MSWILIVLFKNLKRLTSVKDVKMSNVEQYPNQKEKHYRYNQNPL